MPWEPQRDRPVKVLITRLVTWWTFHITPAAKDARGWKGPAKIIDNTNLTRGTFAVRYQRDMPIEVRLQDVRRNLDYLSLTAAPTSPQDAGLADWERIRTVVDESPAVCFSADGNGPQKLTSVTNALIMILPWLTHSPVQHCN